tara:strand:- start:2862 stop:3206 length:345 start_codon:yes stop_codon:yes gene_type:complete
MAKILSDSMAVRVVNVVNTVEGGRNLVQSKTRRRVRSVGGGGAQRPYLVIKTVIDTNNYTADVITPTDATVIEAGVTVKALQPEAGTLPVDTKIFADIIDEIYYIQPSVFYGGN